MRGRLFWCDPSTSLYLIRVYALSSQCNVISLHLHDTNNAHGKFISACVARSGWFWMSWFSVMSVCLSLSEGSYSFPKIIRKCAEVCLEFSMSSSWGEGSKSNRFCFINERNQNAWQHCVAPCSTHRIWALRTASNTQKCKKKVKVRKKLELPRNHISGCGLGVGWGVLQQTDIAEWQVELLLAARRRDWKCRLKQTMNGETWCATFLWFESPFYGAGWQQGEAAAILVCSLWHFLCKKKSHENHIPQKLADSGEYLATNILQLTDNKVKLLLDQKLQIWEMTAQNPGPVAKVMSCCVLTECTQGNLSWDEKATSPIVVLEISRDFTCVLMFA